MKRTFPKWPRPRTATHLKSWRLKWNCSSSLENDQCLHWPAWSWWFKYMTSLQQTTWQFWGFKARGQCLHPRYFFSSTKYLHFGTFQLEQTSLHLTFIWNVPKALKVRQTRQAHGSLTLSLCLSGWRWAPGLDAGSPAPPLCPGLASPRCCFSCSRSRMRRVRPAEKQHKAGLEKWRKLICETMGKRAFNHYLLLIYGGIVTSAVSL